MTHQRRRNPIFSLARRQARRDADEAVFRVKYDRAPLLADLVPKYQAKVRSTFESLSAEQQEFVLDRVHRALKIYNDALDLAIAGKGRGPTPIEMQKSVDDIAIWFASEELARRGQQHVVPIEQLDVVPIGPRKSEPS